MPFGMGIIGNHDDASHQGSAKRDTAGGVAGLDASGFLLCPADILKITRSVISECWIYERTSDEAIIAFVRNGANTYSAYMRESGASQRIQTASMKDVANGIAGLDASTKVTARLAYENIASGVAGLDANILLSAAQMPPITEQYHNHDGASTNLMTTTLTGNGTAAADAANHEQDLSTGITIVGGAAWHLKSTYTLGTKPLVYSAIVKNHVDGVAGTARRTWIGLNSVLTDFVPLEAAAFRYDEGGDWRAFTALSGGTTQTLLGAISSGDRLTIVATSAKVLFFVNGALVATHTADIPTGAMYPMVGVFCNAGLTTARSCSVDYIGIQRYG